MDIEIKGKKPFVVKTTDHYIAKMPSFELVRHNALVIYTDNPKEEFNLTTNENT